MLDRVEKRSPHTSGPNPRTRRRILDGAVRAVDRHGLTKLGMSDVSRLAGVSRGTLYRYFPTREVLIDALAVEQGQRFFTHVLSALEEAPEGEERIERMLQLATREAHEQRALQRLLETEPAFLLEALREQFPAIRAAMHELLAPPLEKTRPVREGFVTTEQLVDWTMRLMISVFLIPTTPNDDLAAGLMSMFRMLDSGPQES